MRNAVLPIPLTHRDARPLTHAEQDHREAFNAHKRLGLPYVSHQKSELDQLIDLLGIDDIPCAPRPRQMTDTEKVITFLDHLDRIHDEAA